MECIIEKDESLFKEKKTHYVVALRLNIMWCYTTTLIPNVTSTKVLFTQTNYNRRLSSRLKRSLRYIAIIIFMTGFKMEKKIGRLIYIL